MFSWRRNFSPLARERISRFQHFIEVARIDERLVHMASFYSKGCYQCFEFTVHHSKAYLVHGGVIHGCSWDSRRPSGRG